jgi:putative CocE/NonD family hydrolase
MEAGLVGLAFRFLAERFAERGYHVIAQGTRGRFDSDGEFRPFFNEADDGRATLDWITRQPWGGGPIGMWGVSYMGYTQWAAATHPRVTPQLKAIMPILTASQFSSVLFADGSISLDAVLHWTQIIFVNGYHRRPITILLPTEEDRRLAPHWNQLPLIDLDRAVFGETIPFYRDGFEHLDPHDPYWQPIDHSGEVGQVTAAAHFVSGWYDFMLRESLADYNRLIAVGRSPQLTIGPWYHADINWVPQAIRLGLDWFDAHLKGRRDRLRAKAVRLYVMGADEWREFDAWPPPSRATRFYLDEGGQLTAETKPAAASQPDHYRYDPADPTPALGGALINLPNGATFDNRSL